MPSLLGLDAVDHPAITALRDRCDIIAVTKDEDEEGWHLARRGGLGGSDTGSVLGLNPYRGPLKLWLQKTGQIPDDDLSDKEAVYWGQVLEEVVAMEFAKRTGATVIDPRCMFVHPDHPELRANPDRLYIDRQGELGVLECKNGGWRTEDLWEADSIPASYEAQEAHYGGVLGIARARIAVLLGGNKFQIRDPQFDQAFVEAVLAAELDWWNTHVVGGVAPVVDGLKDTTAAINAVWDVVAGDIVIDDVTLDVAKQYVEERTIASEAEKEKKLLGNKLRLVLEDAESASINGVCIFTNKASTKTVIDWEAVARRAAMRLDVDVVDLIGPDDRTVTTSRRLNISRSKAAEAILAQPRTQGDPDQ